MTGEKRRNESSERPPGLNNWRGVGSYGTLGLEIALSIAFGFFGGRFLDGRFGTEPWLSILGFVFGIGAAVKAVMRAMNEMRIEAEREEREQGNPLPRYGKADDARDDEAPKKEIAASEPLADEPSGDQKRDQKGEP